MRLALLLFVLGCGGGAANDPAPRVDRSTRCARCHKRIAEAWGGSMHARAATSPLYVKTRAAANDVGCDDCHAPLATRFTKAPSPKIDPRAFDEGVTCDVCHTLAASDPGKTFTLDPTGNIKRGPRCDAKTPKAHRVACSPLYRDAKLCGGCHHLVRGDLPVFTEYAEWRDGPYPALDKPCQDCHMPEDAKLPHHGLLGATADLRTRAIAVRLWWKREAGTLRVDLAVNNDGAGHYVPTGLPGRQVVLRLAFVDGAGTEKSHVDRVYTRRLVGADGREAPFYVATKVDSDNRLAPKESRQEHLELSADGPGTLVVDVTWRELSPELATTLGVTATQQPMVSGRVALDSDHGTTWFGRRPDD